MKSVMITRVELETQSHDHCLVDFVFDNAGTIPTRGFSLEKDEPLMIQLNDIEVDMNEFIKVYKENKNLRAEVGLAIEALKFYAADENYHTHGTQILKDNGKIAKECLNALCQV